MKSKTGALILLVSLLVILAVPMFANAQNATGIPYWGTGGLISCVGNYAAGMANPGGRPSCQSLCDLIQTFVNIIFFIMTVCLFILAPAFFAIGGIMMMVSGANPEMLSKGKSVLLSTVIGIVIVLCSYLLVFTFVKIFQTASGNGTPSLFGTSFTCTPQ